MTRLPGAAPAAVAAACLLAAGGLAGCGTAAASRPASSAVPAGPPLATSFTSGTGSGWSIVQMGGSAAQENNFWELFVRPAGAAPWRLATPAGVADNGGLVVASPGGPSLVTGFRPSQDLTFSPVAASTDDGAHWSPAAPLNPGLASAPDALAAAPGGAVIALTSDGGVQAGTGSGSAWSPLVTSAALAATADGRRCGLTGLTATAFTNEGTPMLAGDCVRPGTAGVFARSAYGSWLAAGPEMPGSAADEAVRVLRLAATDAGIEALLLVGNGPAASIVAAFRPEDAAAWTVSAPLRVGASRVLSTTLGPGPAIGITTSDGHGLTLAGPGASWRRLPALPRWTATLSFGPSGQVDAIAAHLATFTDWRLAPGSAGSAPGSAKWRTAQTIKVDIPYGSSS